MFTEAIGNKRDSFVVAVVFNKSKELADALLCFVSPIITKMKLKPSSLCAVAYNVSGSQPSQLSLFLPLYFCFPVLAAFPLYLSLIHKLNEIKLNIQKTTNKKKPTLD